jgi:hypothetical protein
MPGSHQHRVSAISEQEHGVDHQHDPDDLDSGIAVHLDRLFEVIVGLARQAAESLAAAGSVLTSSPMDQENAGVCWPWTQYGKPVAKAKTLKFQNRPATQGAILIAGRNRGREPILIRFLHESFHAGLSSAESERAPACRS